MSAAIRWFYLTLAVSLLLILPLLAQPVRRVASASRSHLAVPDISTDVPVIPSRLLWIGRIGHIGGPVEAVAVTGTIAYVGEGSSLSVFDVRSPQPVWLYRFWLGGEIQDIEVVGNLLYAADGTRLWIIDVTNPAKPVVLQSFSTPEALSHIELDGELAFVNLGRHLQALDVSDPGHPIPLGSFPLPSYITDIDVADGRAYVATGNAGLEILDVSDPSRIVRLHQLYPGHVESVTVAGDRAFMSSWDGSGDGIDWLLIFDVADPSNPALLGRIRAVWSRTSLQVIGDRVYATGAHAFEIFDASNPRSLILVGQYPMAGSTDVQVIGNVAYVSAESAGLHILDIRQANAPTLQGQGYNPPTYPDDVEVVGDLAYVVGTDGGIHILDVHDPARPITIGSHPGGRLPNAIDVVGDLAYVASEIDGLVIFDVGDPLEPTLLASAATGGSAVDVEVVGDFAYVAVTESLRGGLQIFDIHDPTKPLLLGAYEQSIWPAELDIVGNFAYIVERQARTDVNPGLHIVDVSKPRAPVRVGRYYYRDGATNVRVVENLAYVIAEVSSPGIPSAVLEILDVSNPSRPSHFADFSGPENPGDVQIVGDSAYVSNGTGLLQVYDVTDPIRPVLRGESQTTVGTITVAGELVYSIRGTSVEILRVRELERELVLPAIWH